MTSTKKRSKSKSHVEPAASAEIKRCDLCGAQSANLSYRDGNAVCEKCAAAPSETPPLETSPKKRTRAKAGDAAAREPAEPKTAKTKRKERAAEAPATDQAPPASDALTLAATCERYVAALDAGGEHSMGTMRGYTAELKVACREIGGDTALVDLTVSRVQKYFNCPAVTTTREGEPKSAVGVAKTRRVIRLALLWAQEQGLIAQAPLPTAKD